MLRGIFSLLGPNSQSRKFFISTFLFIQNFASILSVNALKHSRAVDCSFEPDLYIFVRNNNKKRSLIPMVGLSATLPIYLDVTHFLRVDPYEGLFFFERRFRPVPVKQGSKVRVTCNSYMTWTLFVMRRLRTTCDRDTR